MLPRRASTPRDDPVPPRANRAPLRGKYHPQADSAAQSGSRGRDAPSSAPRRESPAAAAAADRPRAESRPAARACRDAPGASNSASTDASSTMRPAYITITRWHVSATTPKIVRDHQDRRADTLLQLQHQPQDLRLDRHVQRGRRLVGDQQPRRARQRHRDHRALAHSARELVRIIAQPALRIRECAPAAASLPRAPAPLCARRCDGCAQLRRSARRSCAPD